MYELVMANKNYSSWSLRPWALMRARGIAFTEKLIPFPGGDSYATFRPYTPSGRVPCLIDAGKPVWDSLAIMEYLAERHPGVWPADAEARPLFDGEAVREDDAWRVSGRTRLFLRPPARLRAAHGLITNFHLPGSSLLMLVACATGGEGWRGLYAAAVARGLRFYSYGDASLILPVADAEETP